MNLANLTEFLTGGSRRVHLIGVAGSGMSGIAALVLALGHRVSGSDKAETVEIDRLKKKGLQFFRPHQAGEVKDADSLSIRPRSSRATSPSTKPANWDFRWSGAPTRSPPS